MVGSEVRKSFQMIGVLPFVPPGDVNMAWIHLKPLLTHDMAAFAGYMEYTWLGTSLDGTSGMPPYADFLNPPTWRKGGTTASRVSSPAPTRQSGASWMHSTFTHRARTFTHRAVKHLIRTLLLHDRRSGLTTMITCRESLAVMTVILF